MQWVRYRWQILATPSVPLAEGFEVGGIMKVYIVKWGVPYEGEEILEVFSSLASARKYVTEKRLGPQDQHEETRENVWPQPFGDWICIDEYEVKE